MELLIKNGTLVTATVSTKCDVAVTAGKITAIGLGLLPEPKTKVVDATGKLVLPGAVDVHVHLGLKVGDVVSADDYFTGTRAAACGGTTTVFDYPMQEVGEDFAACVRRYQAICQPYACIDYGFHLAVQDVSGNLLNGVKACVDLGVSSFKAYLVYDFSLTDAELLSLLTAAKSAGGLVAVHCENKAIISALVKAYLAAGQVSPWYHYLSRPEYVESEGISRAIALAKGAEAPLYIVHLACKEGVEMVAKAKAQGYPIFGETCPQYLHFTNQVYQEPLGQNFVCSPPMKGEESKTALWQGLKDGTISVVATDHCPFKQAEKALGREDFSKIPNGCDGVETRYPYMLSQANQGIITFNQAVDFCATKPAEIFGCSGTKGSLEVGKDADLVIYDPNLKVMLNQKNLNGAGDYTIWQGLELNGYPIATYSRGNLVYERGKFLGKAGAGRFVKCGPIIL